MLVSKPLRKKGGIFIKKINIFLILIASIFISKTLLINVEAETANFYEAEYIDNIYMNKYDYSTGITYFQKARFFRKTNTNEFAYCIEPFKIFNGNSSYSSTNSPNLSKNQIDRISKIAHFGYGYTNHNDTKWYAITQMMIWKESSPGDYYFTDSLNGNRINIFQNEMNEINNLIDNYNKLPSFSNKEYILISGNELILEDTNNVLNNYKIDNLEINNNKVIIKENKEGTYQYNLIREDNKYNKPYIFFQSSTSQDLIETGNIQNINTSFKVSVIKTEIELTKLDKDTHSIIPKGEAKLDGAIYTLYNENNEVIKELEIINNQSIISSIPLGKYYLKETKSGTGYLLDNNIYEVELTKDNSKRQVIVENKVIEKNITIEKKYGDTNILKGEKDISFDVYNSNYEKISTITTNSLGIAEITLPYGEYTLKQINTTKGYKKVDDITIKVDNTDSEIIELRDLKIEVPNTHTNNYLLIEILKLVLKPW